MYVLRFAAVLLLGLEIIQYTFPVVSSAKSKHTHRRLDDNGDEVFVPDWLCTFSMDWTWSRHKELKRKLRGKLQPSVPRLRNTLRKMQKQCFKDAKESLKALGEHKIFDEDAVIDALANVKWVDPSELEAPYNHATRFVWAKQCMVYSELARRSEHREFLWAWWQAGQSEMERDGACGTMVTNVNALLEEVGIEDSSLHIIPDGFTARTVPAVIQGEEIIVVENFKLADRLRKIEAKSGIVGAVGLVGATSLSVVSGMLALVCRWWGNSVLPMVG